MDGRTESESTVQLEASFNIPNKFSLGPASHSSGAKSSEERLSLINNLAQATILKPLPYSENDGSRDFFPDINSNNTTPKL